MKRILQGSALLLALSVTSGPVTAHDVYLVARKLNKPMPDGSTVAMWGFAPDSDSNPATIEADPATVPGPVITVPEGDTTLRIHLRNELAVPVSIVIPGLPAAPAPTWVEPDGTELKGSRGGSVTARLRSMAAEAASKSQSNPAGGTALYEWTNVTSGTYLYHSGTDPQIQVQMGLYGAVRKNAAAGQPYAGLNAENEALALFSEVDPALHQAVEAGQYGTQAYPSALHYQPQFFLINGEAHPDAKLILSHPANTKETLLLRLLNAGLRSREAMLLGQHMTVVAQDGKTYPYARSQYTTLLPAGGTRDALLKPAAADRYSLMDRAMGTSNGPGLDGGMVAYLDVALVNGLPVAQADSLTTPQDTAIVDILSRILVNDTDSDGDKLTAKVTVPPQHGTLTGNNGVTSYTPNPGHVGADSFTYVANDGTGDSPPAQVSITIRSAEEIPVAVNDTYPVDQHQTLGIAAPGVLGNDTPPALAKTAALKTGPANGTLSLNPNGSFTYTPNGMFSGTDLFTYVASAGGIDSPPATVSLQVKAVNQPPMANADAFNVRQTQVTAIPAPGVLTNDTDADGNPLTAEITQTVKPTRGTVTLNANGSFSYAHTQTYISTNQTDAFSYRAKDSAGAYSPEARVAVTIVKNSAPVANPDSTTTRKDIPVTINVVANDTDIDQNLYDANGHLRPGAITIATAPNKGGTATINTLQGTSVPDGTITYKPKLFFTGTEIFTYKIADQLGTISTYAKVTINVLP